MPGVAAVEPGRIAVVIDTAPVVLPVNYRVVETTGREPSPRTWIALRTRSGNVIDQAPMNVAFEIDASDALRREGRSVLVRGTLHHVDSDAADVTGRRLRAKEFEWAFHPQASV